MKRFIFLALFISCFLYPYSTALANSSFSLGVEETVKFISLDEAINLAIERNLEVLQGQKDLIIAKNNIKIANRLQNPSLTTLFYSGKANMGAANEFGVELPIEIGKRFFRKRTAISEKKLAELDFDDLIFVLKMDVRLAYIDFAAAKEHLNIVKQQRDVLQKMANIAQDLVEVGKSPKSEQFQAEIYLEQWDTVYNSALNELRQAQVEFNKVLSPDDSAIIVYDIPEDSFTNLSLGIPLPSDTLDSFQNIVTTAFKNSKTLKIAQQEIDVAQKQLKEAKSQNIPDINLVAGLSVIPNRLNEEPENGTPRGAYFGASAEIPLLYMHRPEINNAQLELEKKQMKYKSIQNIVRQDVKSVYAEFDAARMNLNKYNNSLLKKSENVLDMAQYSYSMGKTNLSDLILTQQFYLELLNVHVDARASYYTSWVKFLRAINVEELL